MSTVQLGFNGGGKLAAYISALQSHTATAHAVRVGFLENADYPANDGGARLSDAAKRVTPQIASAHPDWKPRLEAWAHWQKNHSPQLSVAQVAFWNEFGTVNSKARPFFRGMISKEQGTWGEKLGRSLLSAKFDAKTALTSMGVDIKDALTDSIQSWPADNAPLTVHIKQFNAGLRDRSTMMRHTDFEVLK